MIGRWWRWIWDHSPLAWLVLSPVVTAPLSALLLFGFAEQLNARELGLPIWRNEVIPASLHYFDFWRTFLLLTVPGLVNLLVVLWFLHRNGYMRIAAAVALVVALVRTFGVVFLFFIMTPSDLITHEGQWLMRLEVERTGLQALEPRASPEVAILQLLATVWLFGAFAWGPSVAIWGLYNLVMDRFLSHLKPPRRQQPGEQRSWASFFERR